MSLARSRFFYTSGNRETETGISSCSLQQLRRYTTNVRIEDALDDDTLVATQFDGKPITRDHGGPARVIIPKLYGWKGAKFVRAIQFLAEDQPGFWEVRGYSNTADPWTEDRFSKADS